MKKYIGLITAMLPLIASLPAGQAGAQIVMNGSFYMVMAGGTSANPTSLVLTNSAATAIKNNGTGWIVSENEFNQVDWPIGTNTGSYLVPFGYGNSDYLPVTCDITVAGTGSGKIKFATYHGATWDNSTYKPSDVTNMNNINLADYSKSTVDRFWIVDANTGYTTKPTPSMTFTYIRSGASEIAPPNYIQPDEADLIALRFNTTNDEWYDWTGSTGTDVVNGNTGSVMSGPVPVSGFYRSWSLFVDSNITTSVPVVSNLPNGGIIAYPNPSNGGLTVTGLKIGQVIELYNYLGQMLTSAEVDNETMNFDISTKANGMYLMRVQNKDGSLVAEKKIVKTQ
jgi:hypothetical protein